MNKLLLKVARFIRKNYDEENDRLYCRAYQLLNKSDMSCEEKEELMDKAFQIAVNSESEKYYR